MFWGQCLSATILLHFLHFLLKKVIISKYIFKSTTYPLPTHKSTSIVKMSDFSFLNSKKISQRFAMFNSCY